MVRRLRDDAPLGIARHEAAHVVVGLALGLRIREAVVGAEPGYPATLGYCWWDGEGYLVRDAITSAAGIAWEEDNGNVKCARGDREDLRLHGYGPTEIKTLVIAARAILAERAAACEVVAQALHKRTVLTREDFERMARGEDLSDSAEE